MEQWQLRERHEKEVREVLREDRCMDSLGRLRSWHGMRTVVKLEAAGHTNLDFFQCRCRTQDGGEA